MAKRRRRELAAEAHRRNLEQLSRLGAEVRASRLRKRLTQKQLGALVDLSQSTISLAELGRGGGLSVDTWQRIGVALARPIRMEMPRDPDEEPADAGHLAIQELVLRTARAAGFTRRFELPTRPSNPARSADAGLIHPRLRWLVLVECVNTIGNLGEAVRSSERKRADAEGLAMTLAGDDATPYRSGVCWVLRDVARNRGLVRRYPEIFSARFPGSSVGWLRAISRGDVPPDQPGMIWCDAAATRLFAMRVPG